MRHIKPGVNDDVRVRYRAHVILIVAVWSVHYEQRADRAHMSADSETGIKL